MIEILKERFAEAEQIRLDIQSDDTLLSAIDRITDLLWEKIQNQHSIYFCGNGGSAADAQHLATELSGRYLLDRQAIRSEALGTNMAFTTAVGNDYSFDRIFARSLEALGRSGDVLIAISTSGSSPNVLAAVKQAISMNITSVGITGENGEALAKLCEFSISIPSSSVPRIQEAYMLIMHVVCERLEHRLIHGKN